MGWEDEFALAGSLMQGKTAGAAVFGIVLAGAIYFIWQERNMRVFQGR